MLKTVISRHLEMLMENEKKGVDAETYGNIEPALRGELSKVDTPAEFNFKIWNKILKSEKMIQAVNKGNLNALTIVRVLSSTEDIAAAEKVIASPFLKAASADIDLYVKQLREEGEPFNARSFDDCLPNLVKYIERYGYPIDFARVIKNIDLARAVRNDEFKQHLSEGDRMLRYIRFLNMQYAQDVNKTAHFRNHEHDIEFFETFYAKVSRFENKRKFLSSAEESLRVALDREKFKQQFIVFLDETDPDRVCDWLEKLCKHDHAVILETELQKLIQNNNSNVSNVYEAIYGSGDEAKLLAKFSFPWQHQIIKSCIQNKKKAFLKLIDENEEMFNKIGMNSVLFADAFLEAVNLNTLNKKDLESLGEGLDEENFGHIRKDCPLTFAEFKHLYGLKGSVNASVFYKLKERNAKDPLALCKDLPKLDRKNIADNNEQWADQIADLIASQPLHRHIQELKIRLKGADKNHYLYMICRPEKFEKFKNEMVKGADVTLIIEHEELAGQCENLLQLKSAVIVMDDNYKSFIDALQASQEFVLKNKNNIIDFFERGLHSVFMKLFNSKKQTKEQIQNLVLITKAELSGKLHDIKFVDEDFDLEIGMKVPKLVKDEWKKNISHRNKFQIEETYDYETTIRIGENPVESCLHWNDGMYSKCLLSNFDTNKKIVIAKDAEGRIVARALLRLTKRAAKLKTKEIKSLGFKDVEQLETKRKGTTEGKKENNAEEIVVFLEAMYTPLDDSQAQQVSKAFVDLARQKARIMGVQMVASNSYRHTAEFAESQSQYIYISRSKNGAQYLDSMGGQNTSDTEDSYRSTTLLVSA